MFARDVMTKFPRTLRLDDSIGDAWRALDELAIRHLPIVDREEHLVAMLSDRDLVRTSRDSNHPIAMLMHEQVVAVGPEAPLDLVIRQIIENKVGAVPVVDAKANVIGIVSYVDVLAAIPEMVKEATVH
jgi:acetoin utilization protein AcuB